MEERKEELAGKPEEKLEQENQETGEGAQETVPKKQFDGLLRDIQEERRLRQYFATQVDETKRAAEEMRRQLQKLEEERQNKEFDKYVPGDNEEPITKADLMKAYEYMKQTERAQKQAEEMQRRRINLNESINKTTAKYANRAKYSLDFDSLRPVIDRELSRKIAENPNFVEGFLLYEKDPGEVLYEMALKAPDVKDRLKLIENDELLSKVEGRKVDKTDLGGTHVSLSGELTEEKIMKMSHEERAKHWKEIGEFMKKRK